MKGRFFLKKSLKLIFLIFREKESIKLDGLSAAEFDELTKKAEKHDFDADVSRVMKLIINSIYRNKEIFLRELISNSADALNKVRVESLTNPSVLSTNEDLAIYVKVNLINLKFIYFNYLLRLTKIIMFFILLTLALV